MRQHGTASGPRASAGFDESLPARQSAQTNALVLQKVVAGVNQRIITLTLALGQLDRQMHDTMRSEHTPRERCGGGAVDFRADEGLQVGMLAIAAFQSRRQPQTVRC